MCVLCTGEVGNGLWELLLKLSQENIWFDRGGFGMKYIYRRGLEGLVVARIIAAIWYIRSTQKVSRILMCGSVTAPDCVLGGGR